MFRADSEQGGPQCRVPLRHIGPVSLPGLWSSACPAPQLLCSPLLLSQPHSAVAALGKCRAQSLVPPGFPAAGALGDPMGKGALLLYSCSSLYTMPRPVPCTPTLFPSHVTRLRSLNALQGLFLLYLPPAPLFALNTEGCFLHSK